MQLSEENKREIKFHDELQSKKKARFENRFYKALGNMFSDFDSQIEQNCKNKKMSNFIFNIKLKKNEIDYWNYNRPTNKCV